MVRGGPVRTVATLASHLDCTRRHESHLHVFVFILLSRLGSARLGYVSFSRRGQIARWENRTLAYAQRTFLLAATFPPCLFYLLISAIVYDTTLVYTRIRIFSKRFMHTTACYFWNDLFFLLFFLQNKMSGWWKGKTRTPALPLSLALRKLANFLVSLRCPTCPKFSTIFLLARLFAGFFRGRVCEPARAID